MQFQKLSRRKSNKMSFSSNLSLFLLGLLAFSILFQTTFYSPIPSNNDNNLNYNYNKLTSNPISSQSPVDTVKIKEETINSLGEISITGFRIREGLNNSYFSCDFDKVEISHSIFSHEFIETVHPASAERAIGTGARRTSNITISLNESVEWTYDADVEDFDLGFYPYFQNGIELQNVYLNGTMLDSSNYSTQVDLNLGKTGFFYNFKNNTIEDVAGKIDLMYLYHIDIPITKWHAETVVTMPETGYDSEHPAPYQFMENLTTTFTQPFEYNVTFGDSAIPANISVRYTVNLPNNEDLFDVEIDNFNNGSIDDGDYNTDEFNEYNTIEFTNTINLASPVSLDLNFKANFTVKLLETISGFWCEDRLVYGQNIRERDYKITITDGPEDLMLIYFGFNDTTIYYDHLVESNKIKSALNRYTALENLNKSESYKPPVNATDEFNEPVFTDGISMLAMGFPQYALFKDEIDIITVQYRAVSNLTFTITDKIKTPLKNMRIDIKIKDSNQMYGTLINKFNTYPIAHKMTDENGIVEILYVPICDYTIEVLDENGDIIDTFSVNSLDPIEDNLLVTSINHFPKTIIYFSSISVLLIFIGIILYRKQI